MAERGFSVQVARGIGLVLNLSGLGEGIAKVWLSDPSRLVFSSQGSVLYLKPIQQLSFPGNYHAADGTTMLTVVTQSGKVYQFNVSITSKKPAYTALNITPQGFSPFPSRFPSTTANRPRLPRPLATVQPRPASTIIPAQSSVPLEPRPASTSEWKTVRPFIPAKPVLPASPPSPPSTGAPAVLPSQQVSRPVQSSTIPTEQVSTTKPVLDAQASLEAVRPSQAASKPLPGPVLRPDFFDSAPSQESAPPAVALPPKPEEPAKAEQPTPSSQGSDNATPIAPALIANTIARGLPIAIHQKLIRPNTRTYSQVQSAIGLLRNKRAKSIKDAANRTRLEVAFLERLNTLGRPPERPPERFPERSSEVSLAKKFQSDLPPSSNKPVEAAPRLPIKAEADPAPTAEGSKSEPVSEVKPIPPIAPPTSTASSPSILANTISRGLPVAISKRQVATRSRTYYSVQSAIQLLRQGQVKTLEDAAKRTGLKVALLNNLQDWGSRR